MKTELNKNQAKPRTGRFDAKAFHKFLFAKPAMFIIGALFIGFFFHAPSTILAKKPTKPSSFKLRLTQNKEAGNGDGGGTFKVYAVPFPYSDRVDKTVLVVGMTNTSDEPMEFGLTHVSVMDNKEKSMETVSKAQAITELEEETAALEKDINTRGDIMLRQAKGFKQSKARSLDKYTKSVGNQSLASDMDFGGTGDGEEGASKEKIKKAIDDSLAIIEEDHQAGLEKIEQRYLNDTVTVAPGEPAGGYFDLLIPRKIPQQVILEIKAGEEISRFPFDISRVKL